MIQLAAAMLSCLVLDTPPRIDAWLLSLEMEPAVTFYSDRFERPATIWLNDKRRYAIIVPDRGKACVLDMGRDWRDG